MKSKIVIFIFLMACLLSAQETEKWDKAEDSYLLKTETEPVRKYKFYGNTADKFILNNLVSVYWFFISDQDGERCPFYPSCSDFFLESVSKTNFFQGSLMLADRLTRDMNVFNRRIKYKVIKNNRYYDPPDLYTLKEIQYPPGE